MSKVKNLHWYVLSMIIVFVFWFFVFGLLDKIPYEKQMNLFIAAHNVNETAIEKQIYDILDEENIEQVNVDACVPGSAERFYPVLSTRGITYTDILILPEGTWPDNFLERNVLGFTEDEVLSYFPENKHDYLRCDGTVYGICVYNSETQKSLLPETWIDYEEDITDRNYYLFINASSENAGQKNKASEKTDTQVFLLLDKLFKQ